jgi:predicted phage-related endonuclease
MQILELVQGTPEWQAHRARHFNASDAPAMMGCSQYKSRDALLRETHLALQPDVDASTQALFDAGHRFEALARPLAEEMIGEALYPVVGTEGNLSASFDGLTFAYDIGFEHKKLNNLLRSAIPARSGDGEIPLATEALPLMYRVQMEQQLLISGADKILFMSTAWDEGGNLLEERSCWYLPDLALRKQILDGWAQFEKDLAAYALPQATKPSPVAKAPASLPALRIELTGKVTANNLPEFKETALAAIRSVNRELKTDQDFADAEKAVKWCGDVETRLEAAKQHALGQTASIDALFKAIDDISAEARRVRLDLNKLVTQRKGEVKDEAVDKVRRALNQHLQAINAELAPISLPQFPVDFAGAIKGMRSIDSMVEALGATLANAKITADGLARGIRQNILVLEQKGAGYDFLFSDLSQIVHKAPDDFAVLVQARISQHKEAEIEKEGRRQAEADRRAQERAEEMLQQEIDGIAQQAMIAQIGRPGARHGGTLRCIDETLAETEAWPLPPARFGRLLERAQLVKDSAIAQIKAYREEFVARHAAVQPAAAAVPRPAAAAPVPTTPAPRVDEPATLKLGEICGRLGFTMTGAFVADTLHVSPARVDGASKLYRESDFGRICNALRDHVEQVQLGVAA